MELHTARALDSISNAVGQGECSSVGRSRHPRSAAYDLGNLDMVGWRDVAIFLSALAGSAGFSSPTLCLHCSASLSRFLASLRHRHPPLLVNSFLFPGFEGGEAAPTWSRKNGDLDAMDSHRGHLQECAAGGVAEDDCSDGRCLISPGCHEDGFASTCLASDTAASTNAFQGTNRQRVSPKGNDKHQRILTTTI